MRRPGGLRFKNYFVILAEIIYGTGIRECGSMRRPSIKGYGTVFVIYTKEKWWKAMKFAVVEGDRKQAEQISGFISAWGKERNIPVDITVFDSEDSFFAAWNSKRNFGALIVNRCGREEDCPKMARKLKEQTSELIIIGIARAKGYPQQKTDARIMQWLHLPLTKAELCTRLDWAIQRGGEKPFLLVKTRDKALKLYVRSIMYIEAKSNGCVIEFCSQPKRTFQIETTERISELEAKLAGTGFVRCHQAYLCRLDKIRHISSAWIELKNGSKIMVSRGQYSYVRQSLAK